MIMGLSTSCRWQQKRRYSLLRFQFKEKISYKLKQTYFHQVLVLPSNVAFTSNGSLILKKTQLFYCSREELLVVIAN